MNTVLHGGGYAQMITILHGGGSLRTPKSDYVICARPLKDVQKAELFARNQYVEVKVEDQQRKRERGTKLNSGSKPQGRQRRAIQ